MSHLMNLTHHCLACHATPSLSPKGLYGVTIVMGRKSAAAPDGRSVVRRLPQADLSQTLAKRP
jgi:hypothetical protein